MGKVGAQGNSTIGSTIMPWIRNIIMGVFNGGPATPEVKEIVQLELPKRGGRKVM